MDVYLTSFLLCTNYNMTHKFWEGKKKKKKKAKSKKKEEGEMCLYLL